MQYLAILEKSGTGYSAYLPDLPGCVSVGDTVEETEANIKEAVALHLESMRSDGLSIPQPTTKAIWVDSQK